MKQTTIGITGKKPHGIPIAIGIGNFSAAEQRFIAPSAKGGIVQLTNFNALRF